MTVNSEISSVLEGEELLTTESITLSMTLALWEFLEIKLEGQDKGQISI